MKKLFVLCAFVIAAITAQATEVLSQDTVAYTGKYELKKVVKENNTTNEKSVSYYVILKDMKDKKVRIDKKTYESGKITAIIYKNYADDSRKISKAI